MQIQRLMLYPIKSLRAVTPDQAVVTIHGLTYDRRFMLLQVHRDENGDISYQNMRVSGYPEMVLFYPSISLSDNAASNGTIDISYRPPGDDEKALSIPLEPDVKALELLDIVMYGSGTKGHKMPADVNEWFSQCFGFEVVLAYLGKNTRDVLMSTSGNAREPSQQGAATGWLSGIASKATNLVMGNGDENADAVPKTITFSDCAPYLIVNEKSMDDLHPRLPDGEKFDIAKFRPNIIVSGDKEWEEDLWGEVTIRPADEREPVVIACEQNCNRCASINVDFETGKPGTGEAGKMLKKMMKDRRVDPGAKWSPVFGRYSFLRPGNEGKVIAVGDAVEVSRWNTEGTRFDWPGLCTK